MTGKVLTLVAAGGLTESSVAAAAAAMRRGGATVGARRWLAPGTACDLAYDGPGAEAIEDRVRDALAGASVDLAAQPSAGRRKRVLVADMESTVIRNEMLDELAELAGKGPGVQALTDRAMRGELDFGKALRERLALLEGVGTEALELALERVELDPGAGTLVATMKAYGAFTALVTGGFDVFARPVCDRLGFDAWRANVLAVSSGRLDGRLVEPVLDRDAKRAALEDFCLRRAVTSRDAVAVGDGANDLPMLLAAGLGVAFHAKPSVAAAARYRVCHGDLRTLLYFQGYAEEELVDEVSPPAGSDRIADS